MPLTMLNEEQWRHLCGRSQWTNRRVDGDGVLGRIGAQVDKGNPSSKTEVWGCHKDNEAKLQILIIMYVE